jgi:hypothetical protein
LGEVIDAFVSEEKGGYIHITLMPPRGPNQEAVGRRVLRRLRDAGLIIDSENILVTGARVVGANSPLAANTSILVDVSLRPNRYTAPTKRPFDLDATPDPEPERE